MSKMLKMMMRISKNGGGAWKEWKWRRKGRRGKGREGKREGVLMTGGGRGGEGGGDGDCGSS